MRAPCVFSKTRTAFCLQLLRRSLGRNVGQIAPVAQRSLFVLRAVACGKVAHVALFGRAVRRFNGGEASVFLISLRAGGTGLNLTAADIVIHYDPWWNVAAQNQATDRAYRIGQQNPVQVYKLIAQDTIEEKIVELQQAKQDLAETVTGSADGAILRMKPEELLNLLEGTE